LRNFGQGESSLIDPKLIGSPTGLQPAQSHNGSYKVRVETRWRTTGIATETKIKKTPNERKKEDHH
jgi:hypothetical protein